MTLNCVRVPGGQAAKPPGISITQAAHTRLKQEINVYAGWQLELGAVARFHRG
jgi:hypothetical protein